MKLCPTLCNSVDCNTPGFPVLHHSWTMFKLMSIELVMPSNHLILCSSLLLLPSNFPSIRVLSNELALYMRWPKYWSFNFSIVLPMNIRGWFSFGLTGLISLLIKGFSIVFSSTTVWKHQFFGAQPCLWYIHIWLLKKTIALTICTFVSTMMSLFFNILSRIFIAFLPRSKCFLISWLQWLSAVILEPKKIKSLTVPIVSPSICHEVMGPDAIVLVFWMFSFNPNLSFSSFPSSRDSLVPLCFLP